MALPKQKMSKARSYKRRGANQLHAGPVSLCPQCGEGKMPHRVCNHCGFYRGKKVVEVGGNE